MPFSKKITIFKYKMLCSFFMNKPIDWIITFIGIFILIGIAIIVANGLLQIPP